MASGVEQSRDSDERADLAEGAAADHTRDEVLGQLAQDRSHLYCVSINNTCRRERAGKKKEENMR